MHPDGQQKIASIFGTPIMKIESGLQLLKEDIDYIENIPTKEKLTDDNVATSRSVFLLDNDKKLTTIKNKMNKNVVDYINKTLCVENKFQMTNSWVARTRKEHHSHDHKNAIVSVVYYVKADDATITFQSRNNWVTKAFNFDLDIYEYNDYNSLSMEYKVKTGDFMIFPGWLTHKATNNSNSIKTIIGANYFIKGEVGSDWNTTSLKV